jgi:plastocyanin
MAPLKRAADPACARMPEAEESVKVKDGNLEGAVVEILGAGTFDGGLPAAHLDQKDCVFIPRVQLIRPDQEVRVMNSDATLHNVRASISGKQLFNRAQPAGSPPNLETFKSAEGPVKIRCDVHPWMVAYFYVSNSPFATVTGEDG